jgi:hypothetical protein
MGIGTAGKQAPVKSIYQEGGLRHTGQQTLTVNVTPEKVPSI